MNTNKFLHSAIAAFACAWATAISTPSALAGGDIFDGYIQINGTWYNIGGVNDGRNSPSGSANQSTRTLLSNVDFGTQTFGSFNITGFQIYGWTSFGTSVANNGANYKVWRTGDSEPSYSNFWDTTSETYYSGGDYTSSATGQSTALIGDTFINGATYNLKIQTFTVLTGDNAGNKFYERSDSLVVNGARQLITGSGNTNQASVYNTSTNGGLVKQGSGSLTLTKDNSSATTGQKGLIYIDEGTVAVNPDAGVSGNNALGGSSVEVRLGAEGGSTTAKFALADGDGGLTVSRNVVVRSGSSGAKTIAAENSSGTNTLSGGIFLDDNVTISAASGGSLVLSGKLEDGLGSGSHAVAIGGSGRVVFSGSTNNTGITSYTVNNGATLVMDKTSADAVQSTMTISSGGTAEFAASSQLGSSAIVVNNGTLATGTGSITDTFGSLTNSGNITGNGTLTAGSYTLSGGTVNANLGSGTLNVTGNAALNGTSGAGTVAISGGNLTLGTGANRLSTNAEVTLSLNRSLNIASDQTLVCVRETGTGNGGTIAISNGATLTVTGASKGTLFQNSISGGGGLTVSAAGDTSLSLYGTQGYTGTTTVSGGKLSTGVALATTNVTIGGGTFETSAANILGDNISVSLTGGTYSLGGNDQVGSFVVSGGTLSGANTLTASTYALNGGNINAALGAGAVTVGGGTNTLGSAGRLNSASALTVNGGRLNLGGNETVSSLAGSGGSINLGSSTLTLGGNSYSNSFAGVIIGGGSLVKNGTGFLALSGSNTYSGGTFLNGGTLDADNSSAFGSGSVTVASNSILDLFSHDITNLIVNNGGAIRSSGTLSDVVATNGTTDIGGSNSVVVDAAGSATVNVTGSGVTISNVEGSAAVNIGGTGATVATVSGGTVTVSNGATGATIATASAGTVNANAAGVNVGMISNAATVNVAGANGRVATLAGGTVNANASGLVITNKTGGNLAVSNGVSVGLRGGNSAGVISGAGGITKQSTDTLTLSGVNTFTGTTAVQEGRLVVAGGGSLASTNTTVSGAGSALTVDGTISGTVTASAGGAVGGSGTVGTLNILGGGIFGPGNSPGITTATNGSSWANSGVYDWEIFSLTDVPGTSWDWLQVTGGTLDLTGITTTGGFTINLISLSGLNTQGALSGFNPTATYTNWLIASAPTITGFVASEFNLNKNLFVGGTGTFAIEQRAITGGQGLFITYNGGGGEPIPEPGTWAAAALLAGAAGYVRWRRRKQAEPKA